MSVTPTSVAVSSTVPTLTLAAGTTGAVAVASTIDPAVDYLLIYTNSAEATQGINRNTLLGLSSQPVGINDTQTIAAKTFNNTNAYTTLDGSFTLENTSDATKKAVFSLAGITTGTTRTYTLPNATDTLVGLAATQTLTNKTLTSPTINSPSITNATITADTLSGYTTSNSGTIYGISVANGVVTTAGSVGSGANATNGVQAAALATNAITLGYAQITSSYTATGTSTNNVTGLSVTVTIPAGGRRVKISFGSEYVSSSAAAGTNLSISIYDSTAGAVIGGTLISTSGASYGANLDCFITHVPTAGSRTYLIQGQQSNAGTFTVSCSATLPAFILVEAI